MSFHSKLATKSKRFSTYSYIENEFFTADTETLRKITDLYFHLYGYGPHKYLMDTYHSWKSGHITPSAKTRDRIFECVPRFLSDEKRFFILKNEVIYFIRSLHKRQQNKSILLSELNLLFENYLIKIESFNRSNLQYMVGKSIFTPEEIDQFLMVCKYSLIEKLNLSYLQVKSDLELIKSKLSNINKGIFQASYQVDFLNSNIDISDINDREVCLFNIKKQELNISGLNKRFAEQYILEEFMQMIFLQKEGELNQFIQSKDLDFFISKYHEITDKEVEATLKSEFRGEGGHLKISFEIKSINKIQTLIFISFAKILFYTAISIGAIAVFFIHEIYDHFILLIFGGLIIGVFLLNGFTTTINTLKELIIDLKRYGKQ